MATTAQPPTSAPTPAPAAPATANEKPKSPPTRRPNYNYIHRNVLPIEIYSLPVLIPHNPLSLIAIALSYLAQILSPPPPTLLCNGYFSSATSSIHITDDKTIRRLWEMGFFGKGSLSRSEPTWLETQRKKGDTSEEHTGQRRAERRQAKMERARKEQQAIARKIAEEAKTSGRVNGYANGNANGHLKTNENNLNDIASVMESSSGLSTPEAKEASSNSQTHWFDEWKQAIEANGVLTPPTSTSSELSVAEADPLKRLQKVKTVRFSPTIEAREFDLSSPVISPIKNPGPSPLIVELPTSPPVLENREHLQLSLEEAFFLSYSLGVLRIFCDDSETLLPPSSLLSLFRRHSYFPPRSLSIAAEPDDPFMVSYAAYHHYRSLGWIVRSGVKFSVDYLLYNKGPAFSHAEFAVVLLPSYNHPYWSETEEQQKYVEQKTKKTWWWLHCVNRVQAQVKKNLVLCYVDVPAPLREEEKGQDVDIAGLLKRYIVRDVNVRRWTPNRTRD